MPGNSAFDCREQSKSLLSIAIGAQTRNPPEQHVKCDFDGDGASDSSVFRNGEWWILPSGGIYIRAFFGQCGDNAVHADYDGDGKTDLAVNRRYEATRNIMKNSGGIVIVRRGLENDIPLTRV